MNRKNLANAELSANITNSATSITVKTGQGALLPAVPFYATITPLGVLSTLSNSEIVKVTAVSTNTLTVVRGQRGTTAQAFVADSIIGNGAYTEDIDIKVTVATAVATVAKAGTSSTPGTHVPEAGQKYMVTFTNGNTAASPTLAIDGGTAYPIRLGATAASAITFSVSGSIDVPLMFNGTAFLMYGSYRTSDSDTTYNAPVATWVNVTATTQTAAVNTGYSANNAARVTVTLPATASIGQVVAVTGVGAGGFRVQAPSGDNIMANGVSTGAAGYIDGSQYDYIELRCTVASTTWVVSDFVGGNMKTGLGFQLDKVVIADTVAPTDTSRIWYDTDEPAAAVVGDATTLNGYAAAGTPTALRIPVLDATAKLPLLALPMSKTTDANGWTVYDYGLWKEYSRDIAVSTASITAQEGGFAGGNFSPPVGITSLSGYEVTYAMRATGYDAQRFGLALQQRSMPTTLFFECFNNWTGGTLAYTGTISIRIRG